MKVRKFVSAVTTICMLAMILSGCSLRVGLASARMGAALNHTPVTGMLGTVRGSIQGEHLGENVETRIETEFDSIWDSENEKSFTALQNQYHVLGMDLPQSAELYCRGNDDSCYMHLEQPDLWARIPEEWRQKTMLPDPSVLLLLAEKTASQAELLRGDQRDKPCYELAFTLSGAEIMALLRQAGVPVPKDLIHLDFTPATIPVSILVDGETWLPAAMTVHVKGLTGDLAQGLLKACGIESSVDAVSALTMDLEIREFRYSAADVPVLPQGAVEKAVDLEAVRKAMKKVFP